MSSGKNVTYVTACTIYNESCIAETGANGYGRNRNFLFFDNRIEREWLSTEEAAYFLSVSSNALRIMVHRGQVQVYKFGRRLRFKVKDCRALFLRKGA